MKAWMGRVIVCVLALGLWFGCGQPASDGSGSGASAPANVAGSWELAVDLDRGTLDVGEDGLSQITTMTGHTVEIKNGPAGCAWNGGTSTLTCEILFRNLDSDECMSNVRTRLHHSTNPSAIMTGADYIWPGPTVVANTAQPIKDTGYCITQSNPSAAGSSEGCGNTWQGSIPPGAIATQPFVFTNVPVGQYKVYLQIMADYSVCSAPAGMSLIPAGCFNMGDAFTEGGGEERPVHNVCITSDFSLDVHEVTNAEYAACVSGGGCTVPSNSSSYTRGSYYANPTYNNFPVIWVSWNQAAAYCTWAGKRLPTEAEWEYAARGGLSGKRYPGGDLLSCSDANYERYNSSYLCWNYGGRANDTHQVQSYAANGYGLYDVSGNVYEWVNDWYLSTYYSTSPTNDPPGPNTGSDRVLRGGGWSYYQLYMREAGRNFYFPTGPYFAIGFRCAGD
jgi:formylglycine-generating enzyme